MATKDKLITAESLKWVNDKLETEFANTVSPEFQTNVAYAVGSYVIYQEKLYKCTTAHSAGAWNASHFTATTVGAAIAELGSSSAIAPTFATNKAYAIGDYVFYQGTLYRFTTAHSAGAWNASQVTSVSLAEDVTNMNNEISGVKEDIQSNTERIAALEELDGVHRYGVSGLANSSPTLTRIHDSVGMTAQVGTDGDNSAVVNSFDSVTPFNRRKCVGRWNKILGKAVFEVLAYYGDENYAEDGTMGDYVAVECPRAYFYMDSDKLIVSAHQYPGYRPFDIFCRNHDPEDTIPYYYLPAYALALKDGHAVSLPGLDNEQGTYKGVLDSARTYGDGSLGNLAILQPASVNFYEWALFTVEFATLNCQSIMQGCAGLRHNADDRLTFVDSTHILIQNYQAARVAGEYICICPTDVDINNSTYLATHKIVSIIRSDSSGNASASGTYQYAEVEDLGKTYWTYDTTTEYRIAARPYRTGACNGVSTPSGSPVSNFDSYHPMKYRWRENVFSNQYKTIMDLFNMRTGTGDSDYTLDWYYLVNPGNYEPSSTSKPDATDLATSDFVKLDVSTPHGNYVNGYIKTKVYSDEFPDIWIPGVTTGGSATTYFCDYAYLVNSYVVRAVRLGGYWNFGTLAGFSNAHAFNAPASGSAYYGGDLCFIQ